MAFRISLTRKVLILVSIPLALELVFICMLQIALYRASQAASEADRAREISDTTNALIHDLYTVITDLNLGKLEDSGALNEEFKPTPEMADAQRHIRKLIRLTKDEPATQQVAKDVQSAYAKALAAFEEACRAYRSGDRARFVEIKKRGMKPYVQTMISDALISVPKDAMEKYRHAVSQEEANRRNMGTLLTVLVLIAVGFTAVLTFVLTKHTRRLSQLAEKTMIIARREPLPPPLDGEDEIKDVDLAFHKLVVALQEANHRERAALDNARDLICSIDGAGKFSAVNLASEAILGYTADELFGRYYIDLVAKDDVTFVVGQVEEVCREGDAREFEARMVRHDGSFVDLLWSARWSNEERTLFCVLHDVTARKEAERLRQEVISMVTHDLRTPLTAIRHVVELLCDDSVGELQPEARKMISRIDIASTRMMILINDLLDIEKIKAGLMELAVVNVLSSDLFALCADTVAPLVTEKAIDLQCDENDLDLAVDPDRMVQVLVNLVSNAIKFSARGGTVKLSAIESEEGVELHVSDNGRGIPEDMIDLIFERFQQVTVSDAKEKGGSGLGLAICKSLVELHGGRIWAESVEGKGSTFKIFLPRNSSVS